MKIFVHPSFIEQVEDLKSEKGLYHLFGRIYDGFTVCHLVSIRDPSSFMRMIGYLTIGKENPNEFSKPAKFPFLHINIDSKKINDLKVEIHYDESTIDSEIQVDIEKVDLGRLFVRIDKTETPLKIISEKKVAIIGLGSGGSLLSVYLAKSGVKNFVFIDDDQLETHNIIRHICDLSQLGRFKTMAVKDYIRFRIPDISIKTVERKFSIHTRNDAEFFLELFKDVDLIVAASGEHIVNFSLNDFIHSNDLKNPVIYAGTFDGVKGGLMFKVDPKNDDYCYHCVYSDPTNNGNIKAGSIPTTIELEKKISYDRTLQEQIAQPGLGLDIDHLTILLSKFCLDVLLANNEHGLYRFPHNFYMWFNRTIMNKDESSVKFEGLELYFYEDLEKSSNCPFHSTQVFQETSKEEVNRTISK